MSDAVCRCGAATHAEDSQRCQNGHVLVGNTAAYKNGVRQFQTRGAAALPADLKVTTDEFREGLVADQGGADDLTTLRSGYIRRLCEIEVCVRLLQNDLVSRGLFTPRGRVRGTYDKFLATIGQWDRLAQRLGVDRRARQISPLQAYLEQRTAAAAGDDHEPEQEDE